MVCKLKKEKKRKEEKCVATSTIHPSKQQGIAKRKDKKMPRLFDQRNEKERINIAGKAKAGQKVRLAADPINTEENKKKELSWRSKRQERLDTLHSTLHNDKLLPRSAKETKGRER